MKKGKLGIIAFIIGIVCFALAIVAGFDINASIGKLAWFGRIGQVLWIVPVILGIVACVKKSYTVFAIIAIVLGVLSFWAPFVARIFTK